MLPLLSKTPMAKTASKSRETTGNRKWTSPQRISNLLAVTGYRRFYIFYFLFFFSHTAHSTQHTAHSTQHITDDWNGFLYSTTRPASASVFRFTVSKVRLLSFCLPSSQKVKQREAFLFSIFLFRTPTPTLTGRYYHLGSQVIAKTTVNIFHHTSPRLLSCSLPWDF
jgi:hypothetical protein